MKNKPFIATMCFCLLINFLNSVEAKVLTKDTVMQGIKLKEGTDFSLRENGEIFYGTLAEDTEIRGAKYKAGDIVGFEKAYPYSAEFFSKPVKTRLVIYDLRTGMITL